MNKLTPWTARRHLHLVCPGTINDYTQAMVDGAEFPPLVVFWDGSDYWLADEFHRHSAMRAVAEVLRIPDPGAECEVREGTIRDTLLYACGANGDRQELGGGVSIRV